MKVLLVCVCGVALWAQGASSAGTVAAETPAVQPATPPASQFPMALLSLEPKGAEYGTKPDPNGVQPTSGPGVIDTTPVKPFNNATWFWPNALKIVKQLPPDDFTFREGQQYRSMLTDKFASAGFFHTGVCLWNRARNMYHWVEYAIPQGATRFTGEVLMSDDPFGWMAGRKEVMNNQFTFMVLVDGQEVVHEGRTQLKARQGSGEKLTSLNIPLPAGAQTIRFALEMTPWGDGNKNAEVIITDGMFRN